MTTREDFMLMINLYGVIDKSCIIPSLSHSLFTHWYVPPYYVHAAVRLYVCMYVCVCGRVHYNMTQHCHIKYSFGRRVKTQVIIFALMHHTTIICFWWMASVYTFDISHTLLVYWESWKDIVRTISNTIYNTWLFCAFAMCMSESVHVSSCQCEWNVRPMYLT